MLWAEFGMNLLSVGRTGEAQHHFHPGVREGSDAKVADLLGQSYYLQGAFDDAEPCWRLAFGSGPFRLLVADRPARGEGRPAEAIEPLTALAMSPDAVGPDL